MRTKEHLRQELAVSNATINNWVKTGIVPPYPNGKKYFDELTYQAKQKKIVIDLEKIYSYWEKYYLYDDEPFSFKVKIWDVDDVFEKGQARIRDVFHYESMLQSGIDFSKMIVANTVFSLHIKKEKKIKILPIEIICATSRQTELFE